MSESERKKYNCPLCGTALEWGTVAEPIVQCPEPECPLMFKPGMDESYVAWACEESDPFVNVSIMEEEIADLKHDHEEAMGELDDALEAEKAAHYKTHEKLRELRSVLEEKGLI